MKNRAVRGESEMMKVKKLRKKASEKWKFEKLKREPMGGQRPEKVQTDTRNTQSLITYLRTF